MSELSDKVLTISKVYLGPAAKVFLERQTKVHMGGLAFDNLQKENLKDLSKWIGISSALVIDKTKAEEFSKNISILS